MINNLTFVISFFYKEKLISYKVDKMQVDYRDEFKNFYRVEAKTGNRDFVKVNGKWIVCSGPQLPDDTIKCIGEAIEVSESLGFPNPKQKRGLF